MPPLQPMYLSDGNSLSGNIGKAWALSTGSSIRIYIYVGESVITISHGVFCLAYFSLAMGFSVFAVYVF